jgi:hypothetical protein
MTRGWLACQPNDRQDIPSLLALNLVLMRSLARCELAIVLDGLALDISQVE